MNDMAKNLILWMIIAGVLLTVFNNINQETREENINYSQFIREVRSGRVDAVELAGINITGIRSDNSQFRTIMPLIGDDQLMDDLFENNVEIIANEPEQQSIWTQLVGCQLSHPDHYCVVFLLHAPDAGWWCRRSGWPDVLRQEQG